MGKIIRTDGTTDILGDGKRPLTLEELQAAVGGYIEIVPINTQGYTKMIVNEEGLIRGLPVNAIATLHVGHSTIFGDVVLIKNRELE